MASLAIHALLLCTSIILSKVPEFPTAESLPVEIWTSQQFGALVGGETPQAPAPESLPQTTALEATTPGMTHATKILSGDVLSHPRSRKMLEALTLFEEETRMEQLCGIEAMAQIAASLKQFQPDRVVAYAMAELKRNGDTIVADGAAFRSNVKWHHLKFTCRVSANRQRVEDFAFSVGAPIPRSRWENHNLPAFF